MDLWLSHGDQRLAERPSFFSFSWLVSRVSPKRAKAGAFAYDLFRGSRGIRLGRSLAPPDPGCFKKPPCLRDLRARLSPSLTQNSKPKTQNSKPTACRGPPTGETCWRVGVSADRRIKLHFRAWPLFEVLRWARTEEPEKSSHADTRTADPPTRYVSPQAGECHR